MTNFEKYKENLSILSVIDGILEVTYLRDRCKGVCPLHGTSHCFDADASCKDILLKYFNEEIDDNE